MNQWMREWTLSNVGRTLKPLWVLIYIIKSNPIALPEKGIWGSRFSSMSPQMSYISRSYSLPVPDIKDTCKIAFISFANLSLNNQIITSNPGSGFQPCGSRRWVSFKDVVVPLVFKACPKLSVGSPAPIFLFSQGFQVHQKQLALTTILIISSRLIKPRLHIPMPHLPPVSYLMNHRLKFNVICEAPCTRGYHHSILHQQWGLYCLQKEAIQLNPILKVCSLGSRLVPSAIALVSRK